MRLLLQSSHQKKEGVPKTVQASKVEAVEPESKVKSERLQRKGTESQHSQHSHHSNKPENNPVEEKKQDAATFEGNEKKFFGISSKCSSKNSVPSSKRSAVSGTESYKKATEAFFDNPPVSSKYNNKT